MATECVRSITFTIPSGGAGPATQVYVEEQAGNLVFTVDLLDTLAMTGDLRGLFFHMNEAAISGLSVVGLDPTISETRVAANSVIDLGNGANMRGAVPSGFDIGVEFGDAGIGKGKLDVNGPVSFTLDGVIDLTLDDLTHMLFGARVTSVGAPGTARLNSTKGLVVAPAAPNAHDDAYVIFEDGQSGLNDPSTTPEGVRFDVLANDTDADGDKLTITDVHGALHGTVQIVDGPDADLLPGDAVLYTPFEDYSGSDSFEYCISDNRGGTDFAQVNVSVTAVADIPDLAYQVFAGTTVNQIVVRVTATQTDADSSEFIDRIQLSGVPAGTTVSPGGVNPGAEPDQIVQNFVLTLPTGQDVDFNFGMTAVAKEVSNGDEESKSATLPVKLEYNENNYAPTFTANDQSIWDSGGAFQFVDDRFLGVNDGFSSSSGGLIGYNVSAHVKAGLQSKLTFSGGDIDANLKYHLNVDTSFNKTTDSLLITSSNLLTGGDFVTKGPSGSYKLDFIFNYNFNVALTYDIGVASGNIISASGSNSFTANILNLDSDDLAVEIPFPAPFGSLSATLAWPNISTDANPSSPPPGEFTASGASNNFLQLNLDVDQALADIFLGGVNPFDIGFDIGVVWGNIQLVDLDVFGGLNFLQTFVMQAQGFTGVLHFENGTNLPFAFGSDILLQSASAIDAGGDGDGVVEFTLSVDAKASLHNDTDLGFNIGYNFDVLKVSGGYDVVVDSGSFNFGPVYNTGGTLPIAIVGVYDNTFDLNFGAQDFSFGA